MGTELLPPRLGYAFAFVPGMTFLFENLIVYQKALAFAEEVEKLRRDRQRQIHPALMDQLFRASLSISLNIADGNGRWHKGDRRNFFWIARGAVFECVPLVQLLYRGRSITETEYQVLYASLEELSKLVTSLVQR